MLRSADYSLWLMIKLINNLTGTEMWVAEDRLNEYLAAGHKLAAVPVEEANNDESKPVKKSKAKK